MLSVFAIRYVTSSSSSWSSASSRKVMVLPTLRAVTLSLPEPEFCFCRSTGDRILQFDCGELDAFLQHLGNVKRWPFDYASSIRLFASTLLYVHIFVTFSAGTSSQVSPGMSSATAAVFKVLSASVDDAARLPPLGDCGSSFGGIATAGRAG